MQRSWGGVGFGGEAGSETREERWTAVDTGMKGPAFVPRTAGQAVGHVENASRMGAGPAGCVLPLCPAWHSLPTGDAWEGALASLRGPQGRWMLPLVMLGGHCLCARPCAGHAPCSAPFCW